MPFNAQDFTYPEPPNDIPMKKKSPMNQPSPLMNQVKKAWGMMPKPMPKKRKK